MTKRRTLKIGLGIFLFLSNVWAALYVNFWIEPEELREGLTWFEHSEVAIFYLSNYGLLSTVLAVFAVLLVTSEIFMNHSDKLKFYISLTLFIYLATLLMLNWLTDAVLSMPLTGVLSYHWLLSLSIITLLGWSVVYELKNTLPNKS